MADYVITNHFQPRDFDAKIPILNQIGASGYDQNDNMKELKLTIHEALSKFKVTWKTLNQQKIDYLM